MILSDLRYIIPGACTCCGTLILLWRFPKWGSLLGSLLAYIWCLLLFAAGLWVMGLAPNRIWGLVVCVSATYSFVNFPRDSPLGTLVMGYLLCLLIFSSGVFVTSK